MGGVLAKNTSLETKFPSPFGSENFSSFDWYFSQIPLPNMIYLYKILNNEIDNLEKELEQIYEQKAKGVQIRSREKWVEFGEKKQCLFSRFRNVTTN